MKSFVDDFFFGFFQVFSSFETVRQDRRLLSLAIVPFFLFSILFSVSLLFVWPQLNALHSGVMGYLGDGWFAEALGFLAFLLSWLIFVVTLSALIYFCGSILASPFYALMAERVFVLEGSLGEDLKWGDKWRLAVRMLWVSIVKTVVFLMVGVVLFVLSFFPLFLPFCSFAALLIMAFDCSDYAFEIQGLRLRQRFRFFLRSFFAYSGLASALGVAILIPGLFFLTMPVFVVAATQVTVRLRQRY